MSGAGRDLFHRPGEADHVHRTVGAQRIARPQLSGGVEPPALHGSAVDQRAGVVRTERDIDHTREPGHVDRQRRVCEADLDVPELAAVILAPALHAARERHGAGVLPAGVDRRSSFALRYRVWPNSGDADAVRRALLRDDRQNAAELPLQVAAPALHPANGVDRARVVVSETQSWGDRWRGRQCARCRLRVDDRGAGRLACGQDEKHRSHEREHA